MKDPGHYFAHVQDDDFLARAFERMERVHAESERQRAAGEWAPCPRCGNHLTEAQIEPAFIGMSSDFKGHRDRAPCCFAYVKRVWRGTTWRWEGE